MLIERYFRIFEPLKFLMFNFLPDDKKLKKSIFFRWVKLVKND